MADQRTVTIHITTGQQTMMVETMNNAIKEELGLILDSIKANPENHEARRSFKRVDRVIPRHEFYAAIGYLSTWNLTFPHVDIYPDSYKDDNTDLVAVYKREDGTVGYTLAAIWQETHYSFHNPYRKHLMDNGIAE